MLSLEQIYCLNQERGEQAEELGLEPYYVSQEKLDEWLEAWREERAYPEFPFPNIGYYEPEGFAPEGGALFVDSTGWGSDYEPALSIPQFIHRMHANGPGYYAITEVGEFQLQVQRFVEV